MPCGGLCLDLQKWPVSASLGRKRLVSHSIQARPVFTANVFTAIAASKSGDSTNEKFGYPEADQVKHANASRTRLVCGAWTSSPQCIHF